MRGFTKILVGALVTLIISIAKAEISTASSVILYQPELPNENDKLVDEQG